MAYAGYLVKVGSYTIPLSFIKAESYKVTHLIQDLDSYRDANGILHRNALSHVPDKVEFECVPMLTNTEINAVVSAINAQIAATGSSAERKAQVTVYVPELDGYVTQDMYMPDAEYNMYYADASIIKYNSVRLAFIGY